MSRYRIHIVARLAALGLCLAGSGACLAQDGEVARQRLALMGLEPGIERLVQFAGQGDLNVVELLLQGGVGAGGREPVFSVAPMHTAAAQGHVHVLTALLARGAAVDPVDRAGNTPLVNAAYHGQLEAIRLLVARGADVNASTLDGDSALIAAVYSGNEGALRYLLAHGADRSRANRAGETPLAVAQRAGRASMAALLGGAAP